MSDSTKIINGIKPLVLREEGTAGEYLFRAFTKNQDLPEAFIYADDGRPISYKTILQETSRIAKSLKRHGLKPGSVISIFSENSHYFVYPVIVAFYMGITAAPLNENYTEGELMHSFNISKPELIFVSKKTLGKILAINKKVPSIRKIVILDATQNTSDAECLSSFIGNTSYVDFSPNKFDCEQTVALILCSSGTTGLPKGVMITHKNLTTKFTHFKDPNAGTRILPQETVLNFMPFFHGFGLVSTLGYLYVGLRIILMERFEETLFLKSIERYRVESLCLVPTILVFLAKSPVVDRYDLSSLKEIACGAAPLSQEIEEAAIKRLKLRGIRQGYGLTETVVAVLFTLPNDYRRGSCGKVVPNTSAKIINPDTREALGPNEQGELCFRSDLVMKGYANNPQATREMIDEEGWVHTGDLAYYDEDHYFYVVDRLKELIKYKGFQVPPAELESILLQHSSIKEAAVIGIPDELAGELPAAFVVVQPNKKLTENEVQEYVAKYVSSAKRLRGGVRFVQQIPKTATGKYQRKQLVKHFLQQKSKL